MESVKVTDQDGNELELIMPDSDWFKLLVRVTDENDVPVGMFLDVAAATVVRDALDRFIKEAYE